MIPGPSRLLRALWHLRFLVLVLFSVLVLVVERESDDRCYRKGPYAWARAYMQPPKVAHGIFGMKALVGFWLEVVYGILV